jgi:hypothetical protein
LNTFEGLKNFLSILLLFFILPAVHAQSKSDTGKIEVNQDARVKEMMQKYVDSRNGKIKGYRVQIHFGTEKNKAKEIKSKFLAKYPDVKVYDMFEPPYFKVRAGDFRTRLEAYKFLKEIRDEFPGSFIISDEIELPPL